MVGMFMGDQDPVKFIPFDLQFLQSFLYSLLADPCIDEKMRIVASHIDTVAAASAGNAAHSHNCKLSPICFFVFSKSPLLSITTPQDARNRSSSGWDAII